MAATNLADIRAGLSTAIKLVITNANMDGYLHQSPNPPYFEVQLHEHDGIVFDQAMGRGVDRWNLVLRGLASTSFDIEGQTTLDGWLASSGGTSVKAAVEADPTLGGKVFSARVTSAGGHRSYTLASDPTAVYLGAEWLIEILADGS